MPDPSVPLIELVLDNLWLVVAIACALLSGFVAVEKRRDPLSWMAWGAVTGPIALLALAGCPSRPGTAFLLDALVQQFDEPLGKVILRLEMIEHSLDEIERSINALQK